jgi:DHA1 family multidrug resistance protein-like MFS transporter
LASSSGVYLVSRPARHVAGVAAAIGLCILGDSLLYTILPLEADSLGLTLAMVGVLLSANRLVRLATNRWASALFERWGPYRAFLAACILGLLSTMLYGASRGFVVLLAARMMWGAAWSALRQGGYQAVWSGDSGSKGRLTGLLWGIVRLGSALSVVFGGMLYDRYGFHTTLILVTMVTSLAAPVAWLMPWPQGAGRTAVQQSSRSESPIRPYSTPVSGWRRDLALALDAADRFWLTAAGGLQLLSSSVIIATSGLLLATLTTREAGLNWLGIGTLTGLLQGARWLSDITFGPALGYLSDRFGQPDTALGLGILALCSIIGLTVLPAGAAIYCLLIALLCDSGLSIILSAAASGAAIHTHRPHLFVGVFATSTDIGSALGPLVALSLGQAIGFPVMYVAISSLCLLAIWRYRWLVAGGW